MKVYIAGPLFSAAERLFNLDLDEKLRSVGVDTYLPQRDSAAGVAPRGTAEEVELHDRIFELATQAVRGCDLLVFVLDGRVPDEGACVELGMAYAWRKPCLGLQTDVRRFAGGSGNNIMIDYALENRIAHAASDLVEAIRSYAETGQLPVSFR